MTGRRLKDQDQDRDPRRVRPNHIPNHSKVRWTSPHSLYFHFLESIYHLVTDVGQELSLGVLCYLLSISVEMSSRYYSVLAVWKLMHISIVLILHRMSSTALFALSFNFNLRVTSLSLANMIHCGNETR